MNELLEWLRQQEGGWRTYSQLEQRALSLILSEPQHAAAGRLLADLSARFVADYREEPLSADVAERTHALVLGFLESFVAASKGTPDMQLAALNAIGAARIA